MKEYEENENVYINNQRKLVNKVSHMTGRPKERQQSSHPIQEQNLIKCM